MFVECKWQQKKVGVIALKNQMATSVLVYWGGSGRREHYCVISKSGLTASAEAFDDIDFHYQEMVAIESMCPSYVLVLPNLFILP